MDTFWATFGENWATFYSNIWWSHWHQLLLSHVHTYFRVKAKVASQERKNNRVRVFDEGKQSKAGWPDALSIKSTKIRKKLPKNTVITKIAKFRSSYRNSEIFGPKHHCQTMVKRAQMSLNRPIWSRWSRAKMVKETGREGLWEIERERDLCVFLCLGGGTYQNKKSSLQESLFIRVFISIVSA